MAKFSSSSVWDKVPEESIGLPLFLEMPEFVVIQRRIGRIEPVPKSGRYAHSRFQRTPTCDRHVDTRTDKQTDRHRVIGNTALAKRHAVNNFNNGVRRHFCHFVSFNLSLV